MNIDFDEVKNQRNIAERALPFSMVVLFEFETAIISVDERVTSEIRLRALGKIGNRVYVLIYTKRGDVFRIISFRKANNREIREYEAESISH